LHPVSVSSSEEGSLRMAYLSEHALDGEARWLDARVCDAAGNQGSIVSIQRSSESAGETQVCIRLADGTRVLVAVDLLQPQADGPYRLPFRIDTSEQAHSAQLSFPLMEEDLHVTKRVIDTGQGIRLRKTVAEREEVLDQPLRQDELVVEHVPIGRVISDAEVPAVRQEGDTMVVPVLEEVLVVQKQLLLKEELHITRRQHQISRPQTVVLRSEQITVERFDEGR
jgi:uncharacterized protein (TIGR02271 family)